MYLYLRQLWKIKFLSILDDWFWWCALHLGNVCSARSSVCFINISLLKMDIVTPYHIILRNMASLLFIKASLTFELGTLNVCFVLSMYFQNGYGNSLPHEIAPILSLLYIYQPSSLLKIDIITHYHKWLCNMLYFSNFAY